MAEIRRVPYEELLEFEPSDTRQVGSAVTRRSRSPSRPRHWDASKLGALRFYAGARESRSGGTRYCCRSHSQNLKCRNRFQKCNEFTLLLINFCTLIKMYIFNLKTYENAMGADHRIYTYVPTYKMESMYAPRKTYTPVPRKRFQMKMASFVWPSVLLGPRTCVSSRPLGSAKSPCTVHVAASTSWCTRTSTVQFSPRGG